MTQLPEKPKRKARPKQREHRFRWLILILLCLFSLITVAYFSFLNVSDVSDNASCNFNSDPYIFVKGREEQYFTDLIGEKRIVLPNTFDRPVWSSNSPYAWDGGDNLKVVNLKTKTITEFANSTLDKRVDLSPKLRYLATTNRQVPINIITIFDARLEVSLAEIETENQHISWSPEETHILLYIVHEPQITQLFDLETLTLTDINLPADVHEVFDWIDNDHILYTTPTGRFRKWNHLTNETQSLIDMRIERNYSAGGKTYANSIYNWSKLGGIDPNGILHMIDTNDDSYHTFSVDTSRPFVYWTTPHYILFSYENTQPSAFSIYYYDSKSKHDFVFSSNSETNQVPQLSSDGQFFFYQQPTGQSQQYIIQEVTSGDTFLIEENVYRWITIEGQPYLQYSIPMDDGTNSFYLLHPETKQSCKIGTFYAYLIDIQS